MNQRKGENDRGCYFMINILESMGPDRDRIGDSWIYSQTRICTANFPNFELRYMITMYDFIEIACPQHTFAVQMYQNVSSNIIDGVGGPDNVF